MQIGQSYLKKRCDCGKQALFCEAGPDLCDSIPTNKAEHKNYILRNPVHENIQHGPIFSQHEINTIRAEYSSSGANHEEGGWPKDVNIHDPEATQRYRRKIEKDDGYINCVMSLAGGMEHYIMQNNAIDMYRSYYVEMAPQPALEKNSARTVNQYRDPHKRPIASICWQPETGHRFAVAYVDVDFYREMRQPTCAYLWDLENSNAPEVTLEPGVPMFDLQFNPRGEDTLAGALATGQVAVWDRRTGGAPVSICPPHVAHRDIARKVLFIYSKSGMECFTGGPDGNMKWWDLRKMDEPTDEMIIDIVKVSTENPNMARAFAVSVMEYEPTIPTRFMVGTDNGLIVAGNRKGKTQLEKLPVSYEAHDGPVYALQRNPSFPKNFLSIGDWKVKVWSEECRESAVLWSPSMRHKIMAGEWSPTRLSLFMLVTADGNISLWDLLRSQHEPVLTMHVSKDPLKAVKFQERGNMVLVGNSSGTVSLVELSSDLADSGKQDKVLLTQLLERESKRERILEARLREIKLKLRQAAEGSPRASLTEVDLTVGDRDLAEATAEYQAQIKKELASF